MSRRAVCLLAAAILSGCGGGIAAATPPSVPASPAPSPSHPASPAATARTSPAAPGPAAGVPPPSAPAPTGQNAPGRCRPGDPLAGVYHPDRLDLLNRCQEAAGVAVLVRAENDGDQHIWIRLDPAFQSLARGRDFYHGVPELVLEIIPDCPGRPAGSQEAAGCPPSTLPVPALGDHVDVFGPYVMDLDHGWAEIHPVSRIAIG